MFVAGTLRGGAVAFLLIPCPLFAAVPHWFEYDAARPLAIFSAWKQLTTPRATVCLGEGWTAVGGVLCDQNDKPLPHTALGITVGRRWPCADLVTDDYGRFLLYGVNPGLFTPSRDELKRLPFAERLRYLGAPTCNAAPGYPASYDGWLFAQSKNEMRECEATVLLQKGDRAFYVLKVNATNSFDQKEFARFKRAQYAAVEAAYPAIKEEFVSHEPLDPGLKIKIRLLNWRGKPIPNALVRRLAPVASEAKTDARGYCELPHRALDEWDDDMSKTMERYLHIDAPGYVDGPIWSELRTNRLNVIKLKAPASVSGKIVDSEGAPYPAGEAILVQYTASGYPHINLVRFTRQRPDRSFSFDGIMPGVEFRLYASDRLRTVWTEELFLKPGEHRNGIVLRLPWPGAILGRVLDDAGKAVERADVRARYAGSHHEDSRSIWGGANGQFAFMGISDKPVRIEVEAEGFQTSVSDQMTIKPGELRLIEIRLHKDKAAEFVRLE